MKTILVALVTLPQMAYAQSDGPPKPAMFAGNDGLLNEAELIEFLLVSKKISYDRLWSRHQKILKATASGSDLTRLRSEGPTGITTKRIEVIDWLNEIEDHHGKPPYPSATIENHPKLREEQLQKPAESTLLKQIVKKKKVGSFEHQGLKLRATLEEWDKDTKDSSGAKLAFSRNGLENTDSWNTEGTAIYPITFFDQPGGDGSIFSVRKFSWLPAVGWKYVDVSGSPEKDKRLEELKF